MVLSLEGEHVHQRIFEKYYFTLIKHTWHVHEIEIIFVEFGKITGLRSQSWNYLEEPRRTAVTA